jgi:hypothetical protein
MPGLTLGLDIGSNSIGWALIDEKKERVIDREEDFYFERITDLETGEVIHHCEEPLSSHQGHGGAKAKKKENAPKRN